jgi:hypothetical protein
MATWDFVTVYCEEAAAWLADQGYAHPPLRPDNRLPTPDEVEAVARSLDYDWSRLVVDGLGVGDSFMLRGDKAAELTLLRRLAERAGQLWLYPGSGDPAIVVDATTDPDAVAAAWHRSLDAPDSWAAFLGQHSPDPRRPSRDCG